MAVNIYQSRLNIFYEVVAVVAIAYVSKLGLDQLFWRFSGPVSLIGVLICLTIYLYWCRVRWPDLGLKRLSGWRDWLWLLPQSVFAVIAILATGVGTAGLGEALKIEFMMEVPEGVAERWGPLAGNLPNYLLWLSIGIFSGGLAEEMFFRGYLISRLKRVFGDRFLASALSVVIPALIFGMGHFYYQGLRGLITTGIIGLSLGILFLLYKRNLWPLIIAHAFVDSLVFTALFMQWDI